MVQNGVVTTIGEQRRADRVARGLSVSQLARLEGISRQAVYQRERTVHECGVPRGHRPKTVALVDVIRELAACGLNRAEIAAEVGKSYVLVTKLANLHQIPVTRKPGSGRRKCPAR